MYSKFLVSKTECITCNNQVLKDLGTLQGVFEAEIDRIEGTIIVSHTEEVTREQIAAKLALLGLPDLEIVQEPENDKPSIWGCAL